LHSIDRKFHTDDKNHIPLQIFDYNSPVTGQQLKNVLPISVAIRNFLFIICFNVIDHSSQTSLIPEWLEKAKEAKRRKISFGASASNGHHKL
jgi:hypothetical protein